jgi:hypothetical protein
MLFKCFSGLAFPKHYLMCYMSLHLSVVSFAVAGDERGNPEQDLQVVKIW